jgi:filamentous hemagglutinin
MHPKPSSRRVHSGEFNSQVLAECRQPGASVSSIGGLDKVTGKPLDEYPPAMFKEGGAHAGVRAINPRDDMSAGACIGNACRGRPDGSVVRMKVGE